MGARRAQVRVGTHHRARPRAAPRSMRCCATPPPTGASSAWVRSSAGAPRRGAELALGETPPKVVIQEAVRLAERYGSEAARASSTACSMPRAAHGAAVSAAGLHRQLERPREPARRRRGDPSPRNLRTHRRARARGHAAVRRLARLPAARYARRDGVHRVARAHTFPFHAHGTTGACSRRRRRCARGGHQQGAAVHAAVGRRAARSALVPHLFGSTAFQELAFPLAAMPSGSPSGRSARLSRACPSRRSARARPDDLAERGISRGDIRVIFPASIPRTTRRKPASASRRPALRLSGPVEEV